jgi:hypothetical protein
LSAVDGPLQQQQRTTDHGQRTLSMFLAHSIRLREPWQCDERPDGRLRWSRVFHLPTGLESDDQLVLVISGLPPDAQVAVNGQPLMGGPDFNITQLLAAANTIELDVPTVAAGGRPSAAFPYDARLAIVGVS